jgi:hypothetical protein
MKSIIQIVDGIHYSDSRWKAKAMYAEQVPLHDNKRVG